MMQNRVTEYAIKTFGKQPNGFQSSLPDLDPAGNAVPFRQTSRDSTHLRGEIHRNHGSSSTRKMDGIFPFPCADIQHSLSFERPEPLEYERGHMFEWLVEIDLLNLAGRSLCNFVEEFLFHLSTLLVSAGKSIRHTEPCGEPPFSLVISAAGPLLHQAIHRVVAPPPDRFTPEGWRFRTNAPGQGALGRQANGEAAAVWKGELRTGWGLTSGCATMTILPRKIPDMPALKKWKKEGPLNIARTL